MAEQGELHARLSRADLIGDGEDLIGLEPHPEGLLALLNACTAAKTLR